MFKRTSIASEFLAVTAAVFGVPSVVMAQATQVTGQLSHFAYVSSTSDAKTTSTALVPIPDMTLNIVTRPGPVLVSFCGKAAPFDIILVEAQVDGVAAEPGQIVLDAEAINETIVFETHCFSFVAPEVERGEHRIEMMFRSLQGGEIWIEERSLTAFYRERIALRR
jgi:hypothetical protein